MFGPHGRPIEREHPATLKDPVDDRVGKVVIVQHATPGRERFVGGEDHRRLLPMTVIDDVEDHVRGIRPVREVADFVEW